MRIGRWYNRIKYFFERLFVKGPRYQLLVVAGVIGLISVFAGALVFILDADGDTLAATIWWAFLRLTDPGYLGDDVGIARRVISTVVTIARYVIFLGALVAIMTRWLIQKMVSLEQGLTPVYLKNHIVIVGWSNRTVPILRDLIGSRGRLRRFLNAHSANRLRMVVLTEEASSIQTYQLKHDAIVGKNAKEIILRSGSSLQPEVLNRTASSKAAAIIIPSDYHQSNSLISSDVEAIKTLFSINKLANQEKLALPYVVVEIEDSRKLPVIEHTYKGPLEVVASDIIISRLLSQTIAYPGLSVLYNELLSSGEGNEFYIRKSGIDQGQSLGIIATRYPKTIICGILRQVDGKPKAWLNAPSSTVVKKDDQLIFIALNHKETETPSHMNERLPLVERSNQIDKHSTLITEKKILILGWSFYVPRLINELARYSMFKLSIVSLSANSIVERQKAIEHYYPLTQPVEIEYIEADYMVESQHLIDEVSNYDSIIVVSSNHIGSREEGDARAVAGYLLIDDVLEEKEKRPQVIVELSDPGNEDLLDQTHSESLISSIILSHVLAQLALRRDLVTVYNELLSANGAKITLESPAKYHLSEDMTFHDFEIEAGRQGDTALGVFRFEANKHGRQLMLNISKNKLLNLHENDQVIVLTTI